LFLLPFFLSDRFIDLLHVERTDFEFSDNLKLFNASWKNAKLGEAVGLTAPETSIGSKAELQATCI
jgi:hypothetical protein